MTSQDYYNRYAMYETFTPVVITRILEEFNDEAKEICLGRGLTANNLVTAVLKDQNVKWNDLGHIFEEKRGGKSPILQDGFKRFWLRKMPGLVEFWV